MQETKKKKRKARHQVEKIRAIVVKLKKEKSHVIGEKIKKTGNTKHLVTNKTRKDNML